MSTTSSATLQNLVNTLGIKSSSYATDTEKPIHQIAERLHRFTSLGANKGPESFFFFFFQDLTRF